MGDKKITKKSLFHSKASISEISGITGPLSSHDVRLTPSDTIHNLIVQNAIEEQTRLKNEKRESQIAFMKKERQRQRERQRMMQEIEPEKLPKLGIPALDKELEAMQRKRTPTPISPSPSPSPTISGSSEVLSLTYLASPLPSPNTVEYQKAPVSKGKSARKIMMKTSSIGRKSSKLLPTSKRGKRKVAPKKSLSKREIPMEELIRKLSSLVVLKEGKSNILKQKDSSRYTLKQKKSGGFIPKQQESKSSTMKVKKSVSSMTKQKDNGGHTLRENTRSGVTQQEQESSGSTIKVKKSVSSITNLKKSGGSVPILKKSNASRTKLKESADSKTKLKKNDISAIKLKKIDASKRKLEKSDASTVKLKKSASANSIKSGKTAFLAPKSSRKSMHAFSTPTITPANLRRALSIPPGQQDSWISIIWADEIERRIKGDVQVEELGEVFADLSKNDVRQRLAEIRKHLQAQKSLTEYYPYAHRRRIKGVSNIGAIALLMKSLLASGVLRMPIVYAYVGQYSAIVPTLLILVWISGCFHMYLSANHRLCKNLRRPYLSFGETMVESLRNGLGLSKCKFRCTEILFNFLIVFHQIAILMKYSMFIGVYASLTFNKVNRNVVSSIYAIPFLCLAVGILGIRRLRKFEWFAIAGNFVAFVHYFIVLYQLTGSIGTIHKRPRNIWDVISTTNIYCFVAQMFSVTDCIAAGLIVEAKMKHPKFIRGYSGIFNVALLFSGLWMIIIGFFGVRQYGVEVSIRYLTNLNLSQGTYVFLFFAYVYVILAAFAIQSFFPLSILWSCCVRGGIKQDYHRKTWRYLLRTSYGVIPFFLTYLPKIVVYGIMLLGYVTGPFLMLFCPVVVHFCVNWRRRDQKKRYWAKMIGDLILLLLSIFAMASTSLWYLQQVDYNTITKS